MTPRPTTTPATPTADDGELSHRAILSIIFALMTGMFLAALDQTVVSTAIRTIADDLHGLDKQAWVTTAYLITSTISTPIYGKLSDIYGRKPFFLTAITIFIIGSLACTLADSMYALAAYRAIQGLGAGGLMSLALAIIADIVPPRERARYQGYFLAVFATSSVLGPVVGGFFAGHASILGVAGWRWVFLINVPLGIISLLAVMRFLNVSSIRHDHRIDWWGAVTLIIGLVPFLLVLEQGREWGWGSAASVGMFVLSAAGIAAFIAVERRAGAEALIPLHIFGNRTINVTIVASVIVGMAMFGGMMMLPLYMQIVHDASPMRSGFMMLPLVAGMMSATLLSGRIISRSGRIREFPIIGTALLTVGLFLLSTIDADTRLWVVMGYMVVVGLGLGNCMQSLTLIIQNSVSPREMGVATSAATFFRQMGGTIGVAVFLSMLFSSVSGKIRDALTSAAESTGFRDALRSGLADPAMRTDESAYGLMRALAHPAEGSGALDSLTKDSSVIARLPEAVAHPFQQGYAAAMSDAFTLAGAIAAVAFLVLLLMPRVELRTGSARAEAAKLDREESAADSGV